MELNLIYGSEATVEDLIVLNGFGFEFVCEDGKITDVIVNR